MDLAQADTFYKEVNKRTYFFRHQNIIPLRKVLEQAFGNSESHILSLPCSTGKEPYSLAMQLGPNFKIFGADADPASWYDYKRSSQMKSIGFSSDPRFARYGYHAGSIVYRVI